MQALGSSRGLPTGAERFVICIVRCTILLVASLQVSATAAFCWEKEFMSRASEQPTATASQSEAQKFLAEATNRMERERGRLSVLIPQAEYASDLVRALADNPYGAFHPEVQGAYKAKVDQLFKLGRVVREGENGTEIAALEEQINKDNNLLAEQIAQAEKIAQNSSSGGHKFVRGSMGQWVPQAEASVQNSSQRQLRKTERSQMEQAVWIAGLVRHRYDARDLSDEQLISLHQQALPILEIQHTKRAADAAMSEATRARQEAERALQEAQRARSGW
jgi:hypothetical protein